MKNKLAFACLSVILLVESSPMTDLPQPAKPPTLPVMTPAILSQQPSEAPAGKPDRDEQEEEALRHAEAGDSAQRDMDQRKETLMQNLAKAGPAPNKVNEPSDLLDLVPVVRDIKKMIPKNFSLADHKCTLSSLNQLKIEHSYEEQDIVKTAAKNSIISISYSGPVATDISTQLYVPIAYKTDRAKRKWARYPMGNYTITVNRGVPAPQAILVKAETRF